MVGWRRLVGGGDVTVVRRLSKLRCSSRPDHIITKSWLVDIKEALDQLTRAQVKIQSDEVGLLERPQDIVSSGCSRDLMKQNVWRGFARDCMSVLYDFTGHQGIDFNPAAGVGLDATR